MKFLYESPLRVLVAVFLLALAGVICGLTLPISLFPNSSKPEVGVWVQYGNLTATEFLDTYGRGLEAELSAIANRDVVVEDLQSRYHADGAKLDISFRWGSSSQDAKREVQAVVNNYGARMPKELRDNIWVWISERNTGFLAVSFYSDQRSLEEVYNLIEPVLMPRAQKVKDASSVGLYNPRSQEIVVELDLATMASLKLFPQQVANAVDNALRGHNGGTVTAGDQRLKVQMPRQIEALEDLRAVPIPTPVGKTIQLSDVAHVDLAPNSSHQRSFKTNGSPSLIFFADPKPDGNIKRMSEELLAHVKAIMPSLPKDIQFKSLVDPSYFIRRSVRHVFMEVAIGAILAVLVLFFFVGSFRNTVTALIEIPLSMILAFILMKLFDMNLNLISLGGLALSAGMNVDASVVVMENIFRHLDRLPQRGLGIDFATRLKVISRAVAEVRFSIISATIASLVVFIPLTFTSELTYAILGDLAKAVVFSHAFSAVIALLVVPTVRLHLMHRWPEAPPRSPIHGFLKKIENGYATLLGHFLRKSWLKWSLMSSLALLLVIQIWLILPTLPREIIGKPDSDWMIVNVNTQGNTLLQQMESVAEEQEARLLKIFGKDLLYTFNNVRGTNNAGVMARLKDKSQMDKIWKSMEKEFVNTPQIRFNVEPWNPAELPIPDPPHLKISARGGDIRERAHLAKSLKDEISDQKIFPRTWTTPNSEKEDGVILRPYHEQWMGLRKAGAAFGPSDLADLARVATDGRQMGWMMLEGKSYGIKMRVPEGQYKNLEDIAALPVGVGEKLLPLKALMQLQLSEVDPDLMRENQRELIWVEGKLDREEKHLAEERVAQASKVVDKVLQERRKNNKQDGITLQVEDAQEELSSALKQLQQAILLSILLVFVVLVLQFSSIIHSLLVMVAIPLGLIGVLTSLWIFNSTLSLNSALGVILLNGIAVANSIILVDFMKRLTAEGWLPQKAAIEAARSRLRPILITSLTTILGMTPIALGMGEGGKVLQPLGLAVTGGLWISTLLTLFVVPVLQASYLEWLDRRHPRPCAHISSPPPFIPPVTPPLKGKVAHVVAPSHSHHSSTPTLN